MKVQELVDSLPLNIRTSSPDLKKEVTGGYVSDLLSDVIANSKKGNVWVTLQVHQNIVAVATLKELTAIMLVNGRNPDDDTLKKANEEGILIMVSPLPAFELVGKLYTLGLRC